MKHKLVQGASCAKCGRWHTPMHLVANSFFVFREASELHSKCKPLHVRTIYFLIQKNVILIFYLRYWDRMGRDGQRGGWDRFKGRDRWLCNPSLLRLDHC